MKSVILSVILCISLFVSGINNVVLAENIGDDYYVITEEREDYDTFVRDQIGEFIYLQDYSFDVEVGQGIFVYNSINEMMIYPVFNNGSVIATFSVGNENSQIFCDYSEVFVNDLGELLTISTEDKPLMIYTDTEYMYISSGNRARNITTGQDEGIATISNSILAVNASQVLNRLEYEEYFGNLRSISGYFMWNNYEVNTNIGLYCGPLTVYNIYRNLGYSTYTNCLGTTNSFLGCFLTGANHGLTPYRMTSGAQIYYYHLNNFLDYYGYNVGYRSSTGSMTQSEVYNTIVNHHRYIVAFLTSGSYEHIVGVVGEEITNSGVKYYVFDPHSGIHTTNASNFTFVNSDGIYHWTSGYAGDFY